MANSIETVSKYLPYLDQVYAYASRSAILDTASDLVKETADAKTVLIAKTSMQGLGDYNRNGEKGFVNGDVSLTWESHTFTQDRGRSFQIDAMDDLETLGTAFGTLASEFLRTKVVPEVDAVRFDKYAKASGYAVTGETLTKDNVCDEIDAAMVAMKENEVDLTGAALFLTPTLYGAVKASDKFVRPLTPGENPNRNFGFYDELMIVEVPQTRFYKGIELLSGGSGKEAGGYQKASDGKEINFMIVTPGAVVQLTKHAKMRVFDPDTNQAADAYKVDYRIYHDAWVLENKVAGIYCHTK